MTASHILLLGGISEARQLAVALCEKKIPLIYSIAGLVRTPDLDCRVRIGGFSSDTVNSVEGLSAFIAENNVRLLINATHPYASTMAENTLAAARQTGIPCWRYNRPGWGERTKGNHQPFDTIDELLSMIVESKRPLFTLGKGILNHLGQKPEGQHWFVRTAAERPGDAHLTILQAIGPFSYEQDLQLMQEHAIDALITKDSGGDQVEGKLRAARELLIPVYIQRRPASADADREFEDIDSVLDAATAFCGHLSTPI